MYTKTFKPLGRYGWSLPFWLLSFVTGADSSPTKYDIYVVSKDKPINIIRNDVKSKTVFLTKEIRWLQQVNDIVIQKKTILHNKIEWNTSTLAEIATAMVRRDTTENSDKSFFYKVKNKNKITTQKEDPILYLKEQKRVQQENGDWCYYLEFNYNENEVLPFILLPRLPINTTITHTYKNSKQNLSTDGRCREITEKYRAAQFLVKLKKKKQFNFTLEPEFEFYLSIPTQEANKKEEINQTGNIRNFFPLYTIIFSSKNSSIKKEATMKLHAQTGNNQHKIIMEGDQDSTINLKGTIINKQFGEFKIITDQTGLDKARNSIMNFKNISKRDNTKNKLPTIQENKSTDSPDDDKVEDEEIDKKQQEEPQNEKSKESPVDDSSLSATDNPDNNKADTNIPKNALISLGIIAYGGLISLLWFGSQKKTKSTDRKKTSKHKEKSHKIPQSNREKSHK